MSTKYASAYVKGLGDIVSHSSRLLLGVDSKNLPDPVRQMYVAMLQVHTDTLDVINTYLEKETNHETQ